MLVKPVGELDQILEHRRPAVLGAGLHHQLGNGAGALQLLFRGEDMVISLPFEEPIDRSDLLRLGGKNSELELAVIDQPVFRLAAR